MIVDGRRSRRTAGNFGTTPPPLYSATMPRAAAKPSFEVADANRVLPLVRSIVTDIVANTRRMRELTLERHALTVAADKARTTIDAVVLARIKLDCEVSPPGRTSA